MLRNVRVANAWNERTESGGIPGSQLLIWLGGGWAPCLGIELLRRALLCEGKGEGGEEISASSARLPYAY